MIGSETSLWRWLNAAWKRLPKTELHCSRVENTAGSGMPDVEGCHLGEQFWLELKCAERPARKTTEIDVDHLRPKQIEWLHNRWLSGGNAWILLRVEGRSLPSFLYLIPGKHARAVKAGLTEKELGNISYMIPGGSPFEVLEAAHLHRKCSK